MLLRLYKHNIFYLSANQLFPIHFRPRGVLDPQPTPWSPPAPSELSDTIRHELSSGNYII